MSRVDELPTPALLLDLDVLDRNLDRMARRAEALGVRLRPHVKTHKCPEIAERQRQRGASGLTAATLYEASVFADHGFDDITWAFPLILSRIDEALALAARIDLGLLIDSRQALDALRARHTGERRQRVWLKIDCGYHRVGVEPESEAVIELSRAITETANLTFAGVLTHSGHAYCAVDRADMVRIAEQERSVMVAVSTRIAAAGIAVADISVGSTPAMSVVESLDGITEARPGNYAFYDYNQCALGSCAPSDCAVSVLTSVVSRMPEHSVVDAGALAMSKDHGPDADSGTMGRIYDEASGQPDADLRLVSVSQEHGIINRPLALGSRLRVMPNHSCLTAACFDEYHVVQRGRVVDRWKIWRGR